MNIKRRFSQKKIGEGAFAKVYKAVNTKTNRYYAIKQIEKKKLAYDKSLKRLFDTEIQVMKEIDHPNIMYLYEYIETPNCYYMVLRYCNNKDLHHYLRVTGGKLGEQEAIYFLMQIMNGFKVLHEKKIMHRDIKLENLFLDNDQVVIGDFGFAKQGFQLAQTWIGSPVTMAPEILLKSTKSYTNKTDLWSIGVCFYEILFGTNPFKAKNEADLVRGIKKLQFTKQLNFPQDIEISDQCKDLLNRLLQVDPEERIDWTEFFNHQIFQKQQKIQQNTEYLNQSLIFRKHQEKVQKEFELNRQNTKASQNLLDPEKLVNESQKDQLSFKQEQEAELSDTENQIYNQVDQDEIDKYIDLITKRFYHEKQKIYFIMLTVRKLRNIAKMNKYFVHELVEQFMIAASMTLKMGMIMNKLNIECLENNQQNFDLPYFHHFLKCQRKDEILEVFKQDKEVYDQFQQQIEKKFFQMSLKQKTKIIYEQINKTKPEEIQTLLKLMKKLLQLFQGYIPRVNITNKNVLYDFTKAIYHYKMSIECDTIFKFKQNGQIFDWLAFQREDKSMKFKEIYSKLKQKFFQKLITQKVEYYFHFLNYFLLFQSLVKQLQLIKNVLM